VSYDLAIVGTGELDLDLAAAALGGEPDEDELVWERDAVTATIVLTPEEIGIGVVGDDAPREQRAREFEELLRLLLDLADRLGAELHDEQFGRALGLEDVADAVRDFA
jgi:hypothetical protein